MNKTRMEIFAFFMILAGLSIILGFNVVIPSTIMGIGIAIDVLLATTIQFRDKDLSFWSWTFPITCTHVILPAFGYYVFWGLSQEYPVLNFGTGMFGAILVALFIHEVFCEWIGSKPLFGISAWMTERFNNLSGHFKFSEGGVKHAIGIMAVSWDALWSGPAKSFQATEAGWSTFEVAISFAIAGLVVAFIAHMSLKLAFKLRHAKYDNVDRMTTWTMIGMFFITVIIGGFGVLSFMRAFNNGDLMIATMVSFFIMSVYFAIYYNRIRENTVKEAEEAIHG
jgi:hypothetical protein